MVNQNIFFLKFFCFTECHNIFIFYIANIRYIFYQPTYLYRFYVFFNVQMHEAPGELPRRRLFL